MKKTGDVNATKIGNKKKKNDFHKAVSDNVRKETLLIITSVRTNIYQKIYKLISSLPDNWKQFDFLSSAKKINTFITALKRELKNVKGEKFNFEKYKKIIGVILGVDADKFTEDIVVNMYVAKLQNIIFLLEEAQDDDGLKEEKKSAKSLSL